MSSGPQQGAFFVATKASTAAAVGKIAADLGLNFEGVSARPAGDAIKLRKLRIALADQYGGSMPSGWTRWLLEQFEFPFEVVFPQALDAGNLASRFDVIIFPSGVGPAPAGGGRGGRGGGGGGGRRRTRRRARRQHPGRVSELSSGPTRRPRPLRTSRSSSRTAGRSWRSGARR